MLRSIPSTILKQLVKLSEAREALLARIQEIDREMVRVQNRFGIPAREEEEGGIVTVSHPSAGRRRQTGRGMLKSRILRALRSAGKKGLTIQQLSEKLEVPSANLYVWFNSTGRRVPAVKKIGVAKYRLQ